MQMIACVFMNIRHNVSIIPRISLHCS